MRRYTTYFRKNQVKGLLLFFIITLTIFIGASFLTTSMNSPINDLAEPNSASSLDVSWSGTGDPESARAYIQKSGSEEYQTDEFGISVPTSPSILHSADLNFTILNGHETTHEFEQDSPLEYPRSWENSRDNPGWSSTDSLTVEQGSVTSGGYANLVDESTATTMVIENNTGTDKEVTITYTANFTGVDNYVRLETIGFRILVDRIINRDVITTIYLYNYDTVSWDALYTENWDNAQTVEEVTLPNTRIEYLNSDNQVRVRIELVDSLPLIVTYRDLKVEALIAAQAPLSSLKWAALEFDILGDVQVSGFYAWIRTLTHSPTANLIVKLYRANQSVTRSDAISRTKINLLPTGSLIESHTITNFDTDAYVFIPFRSDYADVNLNVSNYFVVLSSNSNNIYSVATIPYSDINQDTADPDRTVDHLFLSSTNGGVSWNKYTDDGSGQVDAAPFAINLTRPWTPDEIDMKIDGIEVNPYALTTGIYENTSGYSWGLANWNHEFDSKLEDIATTITIPIEFNASLTTNLDFNVSYSALAYSIEDTMTNYYVDLDGLPSWEVNYTLNQGAYSGWNYINSSFALPKDWVVDEFLDPDFDSLMDDLEGTLGDQYAEYWISELVDGTYSINATSPNYVHGMNTYLQYKEEYWETNGFMQGDNISISLEILNYSRPTSEVFFGSSQCEVYYPNNTKIDPLTMVDLIPDATDARIESNENILVTVYEFDSVNIFNTTTETPQGEYSFVFKWNYGNEVGYKVLPVFVMEYDVDIIDINEDLNKQADVIVAAIDSNLTTADTYNVSVFAIEDLTGVGNLGDYHVNESLGHVYNDYGFDVNITQLLVNESLFNPGETVKVNITFENYNLFYANDVTINAQFIQSTNYEWIVMEESTSVVLGMAGSRTENASVELEFTVPSNFMGINGPIRLNPFVLKLEVNINGTDLDPIFADTIFPFVEKTENEFEGRVWMDSLIYYNPGPLVYIFSAEIDRVEQLVHSEATYLMQISDSFFVTCSVSEYDTHISHPIAQFNDVSTVDLIWGNEFQLQGTLTDEFGGYIDNQEITVEIKDGVDWIEYNQTTISPLETDLEGSFNGTYDTTVIEKINYMELRLSWGGNSTIFGVSTEYKFEMVTYENQIQIVILNASEQIYLKEKQENTIKFQITNIGNSTLKEITIDFNLAGISEDNIRIGDLSYTLDKQLEPYESLFIEYYVTIPGSYQGDTAVITLSITCESHISSEIVEFEAKFELNVLTSSFLDNLDAFIKAFFFVGLIALVMGATLYGFRTRRKLQETPQVEKETRPRRGRYVEVAKLQKQPEKVEKVVKEDVEEKTADLDDLLKEEGLDD